MITLLKHFFIKDEEHMEEAQRRNRYGVLTSVLGIFLNCLLFLGKYIAGLITGSIAMTADALNNLSDAGSSIITLLGFRFAEKKPDPEHPFGHGRFEYVSGLIISFLILMMGFELAKTSIGKIIHPQDIDVSMAAFLVLIASILVKVYMYFYNKTIGCKIDSAAMQATATDSLSDSIATTVVLAGMIIHYYTEWKVDGVSGLIVAVFVIWAGIGAARDTISPLLGQPPEPEFVDQVQKIVMSKDPIIGIHDLIVHDYGPGRRMISLHAEVPGNGNINELHDVIDNAERELKEKLNCDAVIHMDPIAVGDEKVEASKNQVLKVVHNVDASLSIHDFRMVQGPTHTNLIFDVLTPAGYSVSDEKLTQQIQEQIWNWNPNYFIVCTVDKAYVNHKK